MYKVHLTPYPHCGLCNQLNFLASNYIYCVLNRIPEMIIYGMLVEINTHRFIGISQVMNLEHMNKRLSVKIIDGSGYSGPFSMPNSWDLLSKHPQLASDFFKHIVFVPWIQKNALSIPSIDNMIHLRIENDAVQHWSAINKISPLEKNTSRRIFIKYNILLSAKKLSIIKYS